MPPMIISRELQQVTEYKGNVNTMIAHAYQHKAMQIFESFDSTEQETQSLVEK